MFKFLIAFLLWSVAASAQDCGAFNSPDQNSPVSITVYSPEGECFTVTKQGVQLNKEKATRVQFTVNYGLVPVIIKLDNGTTINKNLAIGETYVSANYRIVVNKKGKYKLRFEPFTGTSTGPTADEMLAEMQAKQKAEQDARDKEWDDARAKEQAERDARKADDKAKEKAREDARDAAWAAEDEETFGNKKKDDADNTGSTFEPIKGIGSSKYAEAPPEKTAKIEEGGKLYFKDYKDGHQVDFTLSYKGKPACNWDVEILLDDVVVAKGHTDKNGKFSSTYYGLLNTSFKVAGKRGGVSWSVGGFWYMNKAEYQSEGMNMEVEKFEAYAAKNMGINASYASYGLTGGCR